mmetsp:Transcript_11319/g.14595  ORF Transcript_11319/g.14595 Transcript_11319/m.14595 type:complete len:725 (-) Transcript_11319:229-2403(-)
MSSKDKESDFQKQKRDRLAAEAKAAKDAEARAKKEAQATWKKNQEKKKARKPGEEAELEGVGVEEIDPEYEAARDTRDAAMGKGEEELFEKKMSKEEKKAAAAAKRAEKAAKKAAAKPKKSAAAAEEGPKLSAVEQAAAAAGGGPERDLVEEAARDGIVTTFENTSKKLHRNTRDINVGQVTVLFHGKPLIEDTQIQLNYGNRYGFLGPNGSGKSTIMKALAARSIPIPDALDIFFLDREYPATDKKALNCVFEVNEETNKLEQEASTLNDAMGDAEDSEQNAIQERLADIYGRLEELDAATAEQRASSILHGLGFTPAMQQMTTREFSGGWRMRIALARALFLKPEFLLLDEPTNHLDMDAVIWLEDYLADWKKILFFVSHSQDFMNNVCTHIVRLDQKYKKLRYYSGNYDSYVQTRREADLVQRKAYDAEQRDINEIKDFIAKYGHGTAKLVRQAQSREKLLEKKLEAGLTEMPEEDGILDFSFPDPGELPTPVLMCQELSFGYPDCAELYSNVEFGIDLTSRVALVGPNGAGKTTLVKLLAGELYPTKGAVRPHSHLKMSRFTQHFEDVLDLEKTPIQFFKDSVMPKKEFDYIRSWLGRYGCAGAVQTQIMNQLSAGQKARIVFAKMASESPHLILLDEPTNALDMNAIDSLARAINNFKGGVILVSHDMRLISQVAKELWICDHKQVKEYRGDIMKFKLAMRKQIKKASGKAVMAQHLNG